MFKKRNLLFFPCALFCLSTAITIDAKANSRGPNGADIYCFMRTSGIAHEPSWQAAYTSIKNYSKGFFKTSPKQAASTIVEEVVQNTSKYENCSRYLGDLFGADPVTNQVDNYNTPAEADNILGREKGAEAINSEADKGTYIDRYNY